MLRFDRKQQNSAKQLKDFHEIYNFYKDFNFKKIKRKKRSTDGRSKGERKEGDNFFRFSQVTTAS